jgi:hypothetical protein
MLHKNRYIENLVARRDFFVFETPKIRSVGTWLAVGGLLTMGFFAVVGGTSQIHDQYNAQVRAYRAENGIEVERWMPPMYRVKTKEQKEQQDAH